MPRLEHGSLKGYVKSNFDDLVVLAQHGLAHGDHPRVSDEINEATHILRMDFHIPAAGTTTHCTAGTLNGAPEGGHHVFAHGLSPIARESSFQPGDAIALQRFNMFRNISNAARPFHALGFHAL